ncbi:MAG: hypothetical protein QOE98_1777 [Gaiellaceae bacterium]|jgi:hypothetical protein|nr:hypothetical protein [Gaiellaceae bacterium]
MQERWLLVTVVTAESPGTLRIQAWRNLRCLGAHYLQHSVCLLPARPVTTTALARLLARVERQGGHARVFEIGRLDETNEKAVIDAFSAERSDEYGEVVSRTREFLAEIAMERDRGRATYMELEESDVDLKRLQRWLAAIRSRDYFDAPAYADAAAAVERCECTLAEFEAEAFASELRATAADGPALLGSSGLSVLAQPRRG